MSPHVVPLSVHNSARIALKHRNEVHMTPSVLRFPGTPSASVWVSKHLSSLQKESSSLVHTGNQNKGVNPRRGNGRWARPIFGWYIQRYIWLTIYHKLAISSQEISALLPQFWFHTFVKCSTDRKEKTEKFGRLSDRFCTLSLWPSMINRKHAFWKIGQSWMEISFILLITITGLQYLIKISCGDANNS